MYPITSAPVIATYAPPRLPSLGEPVYNIAGTSYTASQFDALLEHGGRDAGYYELVPVRRFLAWLTEKATPDSAAQQRTPALALDGPAWIVAYLCEYDGSLWAAYDEGAQARKQGQPATEPTIPYTPFERFLYALPSCTPGQARAAILAYLTRIGYAAQWFSTLCQYGEQGQLIAPSRFVAWLAQYAAQAEATDITNGASLASTYLLEHTGLLWTAYVDGLQPRLAGGPDIGAPVPYSPFEYALAGLPDSTFAQAQADIFAYLAAQRNAAH